MNNTGILKAICLSEKRGLPKTPAASAVLKADWGIEGDAHAGKWHRQISLLPEEQIKEFNSRGAQVSPGAFGENLIVSGFDLKALPPGTRLEIGPCLLEITQTGKQCHHHCAVYQRMGDCIMPREGVFARVIRGGLLKPGDPVRVLETGSREQANRSFRAAVITMSDRGSRGERQDESGPYIAKVLSEAGYEVAETVLVPDDESRIREELIRLSDTVGADLIITTGGTGLAPRDVTPEATLAVATRNVPGIAEAIRAESLKFTKRAMLSRAVSVIRNRTLIVNLPGSRKAVSECLEVILDTLSHGLGILTEREGECGRS